jgi:hypothetical protein
VWKEHEDLWDLETEREREAAHKVIKREKGEKT